MQYRTASGGYTELRPARLRLEAVPSFARTEIIDLFEKGAARPQSKVFKRRTGFWVVIWHSVEKGAPRPLDRVGLDYKGAINPSSHSLLAQRMGEERHSLRRREGLFRASDR